MIQKHSLKSILSWIPKVLFGFCLGLLVWVGQNVFQADLDFVKTRITESHEALHGALEQKIYEDLESIGTEVMSIAKLQDTSSLGWLELNQDRVIAELTQRILSDSEWNSLKNGKIPKPIILRVYRIQAPSFVKTVNRLERLFDGRQRRLTHSSKDIHPILQQIDNLNIKLYSDYESQIMGLTLQDWHKLAKLSEPSNVPFLETIKPAFLHPLFMEGKPSEGISPISRQLFLSTEVDTTSYYPIPAFEAQFLDNYRVLEEQINDNEEMPLLWITGYLFSRLSRFGPNLHPLHKMLEANPEFQPLEARGQMFSMLNVSMGWEIFPLDFMTNNNLEIIPILPQRIIAAMINQPRIIRSLLPRHLNDSQLEYRQVWYQFPDQNEKLPLPQNLDPLLLKGSQPLKFSLMLKDREHLCTSIRSISLAMARIQICESADPQVFGSNQSFREIRFANRWRVIFVLMLLALILAYKPLSNWGQRLNSALNSCIESFMGKEQTQDTKNMAWEFLQLNNSVNDLKATVNLRNLDFALALGIQEILNQPGKRLQDYAEDMQYFLKENTGTPKWKLNLTEDNSLSISYPDSVAASTKALLEELAQAAKIKSDLESQSTEHQKMQKEMALAEVLTKGLLPESNHGQGAGLSWHFQYEPSLQIPTQILMLIIHTQDCSRICLLEIPRPHLGATLMASALKARVQAVMALFQPFSLSQISEPDNLLSGVFIETGKTPIVCGTEPFKMYSTGNKISVESQHQNFHLEVILS